MLLSVPERLTMLGVLPREGNFVTLKLIRELRETLSFSDEEVQQFKIVAADDRVTWDKLEIKDKDIEIGRTMNGLIVETLTKLDQQKRLTDAHVSLYEKFVQPDGQG